MNDIKDAYMTGNNVSLIDNNVWSPSALPSGWEEVL